MRRSIAVGFLIGAWAMGGAVATADDKNKDEKQPRIAVRDDCDSRDPAWSAVPGGCTRKGDVTFAEFGQFISSPLVTPGIVGHPAWVMDPTYFKTEPVRRLIAKNEGGENHTFTFVQNFGGGFVPFLNGNMREAPECVGAPAHILPPVQARK